MEEIKEKIKEKIKSVFEFSPGGEPSGGGSSDNETVYYSADSSPLLKPKPLLTPAPQTKKYSAGRAGYYLSDMAYARKMEYVKQYQERNKEKISEKNKVRYRIRRNKLLIE